MTNAELITQRTNEMAEGLRIADQLDGMTTSEKLAEMARRFDLLKGDNARRLSEKCREALGMAHRFGV